MKNPLVMTAIAVALLAAPASAAMPAMNTTSPLTVGHSVMIPMNVEHRIDNASKTAQLVFSGFMIGSNAKSVRYKMTEGETHFTPGCPH